MTDATPNPDFRTHTTYLQGLRLDNITFTQPLRPTKTLPLGTKALNAGQGASEGENKNPRLSEPEATCVTKAHPVQDIEVFARIITSPGGENRPYLLFLQGGPGFEAQRPALTPHNPTWLKTALERYRVVMLDQRGTGRSTPVSASLLSTGSAEQVAEYLTHLRADAIVRDAEALRQHLGVDKWSTLGQSFGGFTTLHYLCVAPQSLQRVFITGGLSGLGKPATDVYAATYEKMRWLSEKYYARHPRHRDIMRRLVARAAAGEVVLPSGEALSATRVRTLGHLLGSNDGWFTLHSLLDLAEVPVLGPVSAGVGGAEAGLAGAGPAGAGLAGIDSEAGSGAGASAGENTAAAQTGPYSDAFLADLEAALPYDGRNPLYYVLHESSYADGVVTDWAAEKALPTAFAEDPTLLFGEHVFSGWLDTVPAFKPWKEVAQILALHSWPQLYSGQALEESHARGAASVYFRDAYVPFEFALETAQHLPGVELFVTSEHEHNGLRASEGKVLEHLFELAEGKILR